MDALRVVAEHQQERAREAVEHVDADFTRDLVQSATESTGGNESMSKIDQFGRRLREAKGQTETATQLMHAMSLRDVGFSEVARNTHKKADSLGSQLIAATTLKIAENVARRDECELRLHGRSSAREMIDWILNNLRIRELEQTPFLRSAYTTVLEEAREYRRGLD